MPDGVSRDAEQGFRIRRPGERVAANVPRIGGFADRRQNCRGIRHARDLAVLGHVCPFLERRRGTQMHPRRLRQPTLGVIPKYSGKTDRFRTLTIREG